MLRRSRFVEAVVVFLGLVGGQLAALLPSVNSAGPGGVAATFSPLVDIAFFRTELSVEEGVAVVQLQVRPLATNDLSDTGVAVLDQLNDIRTLVRLNLEWGQLSLWANASHTVAIPLQLLSVGRHGILGFAYRASTGELVSSGDPQPSVLQIDSLPPPRSNEKSSSARNRLRVLPHSLPRLSYSFVFAPIGNAGGAREHWFEFRPDEVNATVDAVLLAMGAPIDAEHATRNAVRDSLGTFVDQTLTRRLLFSAQFRQARSELLQSSNAEGEGSTNTMRATPQVRVIFGAGGLELGGWVSTEQNIWNLLSRDDYEEYLGPRQGRDLGQLDVRTDANVGKENLPSLEISHALAEHVWEHLSPRDAIRAAELLFEFMAVGGRVRAAVPDWWRPGSLNGNESTTMIVDDLKYGHTVQYNAQSFAAIFQAAGFRVQLLECHGKDGKAWTTGNRTRATNGEDTLGSASSINVPFWDEEDGGLIRRCSRHDHRGAFSVLIDAEKVAAWSTSKLTIAAAALPPILLDSVHAVQEQAASRRVLLNEPTSQAHIQRWGSAVDEQAASCFAAAATSSRRVAVGPVFQVVSPRMNALISPAASGSNNIMVPVTLEEVLFLNARQNSTSLVEVVICWSADRLEADIGEAFELAAPSCQEFNLSEYRAASSCGTTGVDGQGTDTDAACRSKLHGKVEISPLELSRMAKVKAMSVRLSVQVYNAQRCVERKKKILEHVVCVCLCFVPVFCFDFGSRII